MMFDLSHAVENGMSFFPGDPEPHIEKYQPLLSLHGHIHESRGDTTIGRTVAINPGSEYGEGLLRGAIVTLSGDTVVNVPLTSG
jgi:Icc-related predicted phosphoesterase